MATDQNARRPSLGRRHADLKVTVIRRDNPDPAAWSKLVETLRDLLYAPTNREP